MQLAKTLIQYGEDMLKICTIYYDGIYTPDYVSKLYRSLKSNTSLPFEFICLSDTDVEADLVLPYNHTSNIKLHWHKLKFFSPQFAYQNPDDDIIIMDIDQVITNNVDDLIGHKVNKNELVTYDSWWSKDLKINGGFYKFYPEDTKVLYNLFKNDKRFWERYFIDVKKVKIGPVAGEENFVDFAVRKFGLDLKFIPDEWTSRWVKNPNKEWLSKINKKYPGKYLKLDKFNDNVKLLHYTMND